MRILTALLISLIFHFFLAVLMENQAHRIKLKQLDKIGNVEVELIEEKPKALHQKKIPPALLQTEVPDKVLKNLDDSLALIISERTQRVKKQTRAAYIGKTRNKNSNRNSKYKNLLDNPNNLEEIAKRSIIQEASGTLGSLKSKNKSEEIAYSTINRLIEDDIPVGSMNILNTDAGGTYYSFYKRFSEQLGFRWVTKVRLAQTMFNPQQLNNIWEKGKVWRTEVEFWLTPDGHYHSAHLMKESGIRHFDMAAILALKEARVIANPPKELVDEDGYIRLRVSFNVYFERPIIRSE